jgi:hypothetical protein
MSAAISVRDDFEAEELRVLAGRVKDANQARRLLAIAAVYDGMDREEAARIGGMDRQLKRAGVPAEYRTARTKPEMALAEIDQGGKKESTGRRRSRPCPPCVRPSSNSSLDDCRSNVRTAENGFATSGGVRPPVSSANGGYRRRAYTRRCAICRRSDAYSCAFARHWPCHLARNPARSTSRPRR